MDNISTGDEIISRVCQKKSVTKTGEEWIKAALDPFPDETRYVAGVPDQTSSKSVVQVFKYQKTITDGGIGANWDCNILFQGSALSNKLRTTIRSGNCFQNTGQGVTDYDIGGFQVRRAAAGTTLFVPTIVDNILPTFSSTMPFRVISLGMEVINVTAPIYQQGSCVVWRQPSTFNDHRVANVSTLTTASGTAVPITFILEAPTTSAEALILPGSLEWHAKEGVYAVGTPSGPVNYICSPQSSGANNDNPHIISNALNYFPQITGGAHPFAVANTSPSIVPMNSFGAFFTGLSSQSALTVVMHIVVERFPQPTDTDLIVLATPTAPFDPNALEMYAQAAAQLPVGTMSKNNGLGAWFLQAATSIARWAAPKLLKGFENNENEDLRKKEIEALTAKNATLEATISGLQSKVDNSIKREIRMRSQIQPKKKVVPKRAKMPKAKRSAAGSLPA